MLLKLLFGRNRLYYKPLLMNKHIPVRMISNYANMFEEGIWKYLIGFWLLCESYTIACF